MSETIDLPEEMSESSGVVGLIQERMRTAEDGRQSHEERWLKAYKNFRGVYDSSTQYTSTEKSKVFIKITKTKVLAAYGQIVDILFANKKFPINIESTPVPEGIAEFAHLRTPADELSEPFGYEGDGREISPGALEASQPNLDVLGSLGAKFGEDPPIVEGPAKIGEPQISPAKSAALKMEKTIHDQLTDSNAVNVLRHAIFESSLLGTGIVKGPFTFHKTLHVYDKNEEGFRQYNPKQVKVPKLEHVSLWDFYPDPNATSIEECEFTIQRHKFNRNQLRNLLNRPFFDKEAIIATLEDGPNYQDRSFESNLDLGDETYESNESNSRFEVLEYWGIVDTTTIKESGLKLPEEFTEENELQINAWVTEGRILRMVLNPFQPYRLPYHAFPYERNPYSFFGIGVPENMSDAQAIMNGHARMAIDNLALSGSLVFDIDESALVAGQSMDVYPGKIFRRQAGMPGQAVHGLKFPNTATENMMMFDKFRQLADESTGIPSYSHGQTGVQSMTRTASGMSMLLSAANLNVKTVIKNIDDYLLRPLGESFFQWNMQFYEGDLNIEGDLEIRATGTASLMQKEVRSQRLTMFLQTVQNPAIAPFVKISEIIKELAYSLDLDPDEVINDPAAAEIYAKIIGLQNAQQQGQEQPTGPGVESAMGGAQGVPPKVAGTDSQGTGDGTIGTGNVSQPGEMEFTGTVDTPPGQPQE